MKNSGSAFAASAFNHFQYNLRSELEESARYLGTDETVLTSPVTAELRGFVYDPIGNRKTSTVGANAGSYTANDLNQYTSEAVAGGGSNTYTYDDDGNLTGITGNKDVTYTYNAENRLVTAEPNTPAFNDKKVDMVYDYQGRRVEKNVSNWTGVAWVPENTKHFVYDGWNVIEEQGVTSKYYVWGLDLSQSMQGAGGIGGLLTQVDVGAVKSYAYTYDGNGNVGQLLDNTDGSIDAHYEYDPYGNELVASGVAAASNPYRFSTKYLDSEFNLYYYGFRYYDPESGRWLNRDSLGEIGGLNLYKFVYNNPYDWYDNLGNAPDGQRDATKKDGSIFAKNFELLLRPLKDVFDRGKNEILSIFRQFKEDAKSKVSYSYDIRRPSINVGIFKSKFGGALKISSDGCKVKVTGAPTFAVSANSPGFVTVAGGVTVTGGINYEYNSLSRQEDWFGSLNGTGWLGLRAGLDAWVVGAFAEGGVFASYGYNFQTEEDKFGVGGYIRAVFESGIIWKRRRQYKYAIGDPDVFF